jgi:hypothetical protein
MTKNHTDGFHEARLWVKLVIIPAVTMAAIMLINCKAKRKITVEDVDVINWPQMISKKKETCIITDLTQEQGRYVRNMIERYENGEASEKEWQIFLAEWMV